MSPNQDKFLNLCSIQKSKRRNCKAERTDLLLSYFSDVHVTARLLYSLNLDEITRWGGPADLNSIDLLKVIPHSFLLLYIIYLRTEAQFNMSDILATIKRIQSHEGVEGVLVI